MLRATEIVKHAHGPFAGEVILDFQDRHRRRISLKTQEGQEFLLDLSDVPDLREGDGIRLSDGGLIAVRAAPEALMEIRGHDGTHMARLAWHIGNRHLAAEIGEGFLRIRADHVIAEMVKGLGGSVLPVTAPFNPEGGAYGGPAGNGGHSHHHHGHGHG